MERTTTIDNEIIEAQKISLQITHTVLEAAAFHEITSENPHLASSIVGGILSALVQYIISHDPDEQPDTMAAMIADLVAHLAPAIQLSMTLTKGSA